MPAYILPALLLVLAGSAQLQAQESVAADTAPGSSPGLLTPPPDTSAPAASSSNSAPTTTSAADAGAPGPGGVLPVTGPTTTSKPMTQQEIARLQQQEIIRRQDLIFRANDSLTAARKAELAKDYPEARKDYLFCCQAYGSISRSTASYAKSADGLTRVDFQLYDSALARGDTKLAKRLIDEVVQYNPNNEMANRREAAVNRALANPNDTSILGNPAVTPGFVNEVNQVQQLFDLAEQYRRTGQWDLAEESLKKILVIDPYNIGATKSLEKIDAEKNQYGEHARLQTRDERLRQVEEAWAPPITNTEVGGGPQEGQPVIEATTTFNIDQKLKSIYLSLDFDNATIQEATDYLNVKSKDLDPDKKGVNFIVEPDAAGAAKPITLTLTNVPLGEALRYVCQLGGVKFKVEDYAISIVPFSQNTEELISRTFIVQPNFVAPPQAEITDASAVFNGTPATAGGGGGGGGRPLPAPTAAPADTTPAGSANENTVMDALKLKGLQFPEGASAVYTPTTGQLTVVDTADQMELLEELVNAGQAPTLMVRVATKFVEINQTDLNDLTANIAANALPPSAATLIPSVTGANPPHHLGFNTNLPGARALSPDSIDFLITPTSQTFNTINVSFFNTYLFQFIFDMLAQKRSFDLLSEPAVLTKSGETGTVQSVRDFPYPIAFDPPQLATPVSTVSGGVTVPVANPPAAIPTIPTDFKRRLIGVRLVVKPQIAADNRTIDLSLFPEVTDFEGFINYGSPIQVANPPGFGLPLFSLLASNVINQPVFNVRRVNTKVLIRDGSTVVLGGLMRDDVETVNDSVPLLSQLPLVGRLFQSKAIEDTKRNLIIFVTATIYRSNGELLNAPETVDATSVLTGHASSVQ